MCFFEFVWILIYCLADSIDTLYYIYIYIYIYIGYTGGATERDPTPRKQIFIDLVDLHCCKHRLSFVCI